MSRDATTQVKRLRSNLEQHIHAELELGIKMAGDPANTSLPELALRVTSINSVWFTQMCRVCKDKFREGDYVRVCPTCSEPYHDDQQYDLYCWQKHFAAGAMCKGCSSAWPVSPSGEASLSHHSLHDLVQTPHTHRLVNQFVVGVETVWRPFGQQPSRKVPHGSPLIGRKCPWCRFRVRAGDWVVECPCQSNCGVYFHQDIFRRLTCWNEWNGVDGNQFCPETGARYPAKGGADAG
jgi:hypothetical protein